MPLYVCVYVCDMVNYQLKLMGTAEKKNIIRSPIRSRIFHEYVNSVYDDMNGNIRSDRNK